MSMIFSLLLAQAAPAVAPSTFDLAAPSSETVAEEILVIGRKLETWKGGVYKRDDKLTCRITQSTGDKDIDAIRCGAMLRCFAPETEAFDRIAASDVPEADRNRQMQALAEKLKPCVAAADEAGTRHLAERRAEAS